jgi:lysyl-tRNA synthetase class 2
MNWRPSAPLATLAQRAAMLRGTRDFFADRGLLEVETPQLVNHAVSEPQVASLAVDLPGGPRMYLHTSPEYPMKRLLAAGSGDIWQLSRVFRAGEAGRLHQPEFTLLEWYRLGFTLDRLAAETCALVQALATQAANGSLATAPVERHEYRTLFRQFTGLDAWTASAAELATGAHQLLPGQLGRGVTEALGADPDLWLDLLMSRVVMPRLGSVPIVVVSGFPASQAALARLRPDDPATAERFELFCFGVEVANGYRELTDPHIQRARFERDRDLRRQRGLPDAPPDEDLLAALEHGLPDCAGVAVGFDRLVMLLLGRDRLEDVLGFPVIATT